MKRIIEEYLRLRREFPNMRPVAAWERAQLMVGWLG